jgi:hypothetical protein
MPKRDQIAHRPSSVGLTAPVGNPLHPAATGRQIDAVQAVEPSRPLQITRAHKIGLMDVARALGLQGGVSDPFGHVRPALTCHEPVPLEHPTDAAQARRAHAQLGELPRNGLGAVKQLPLRQAATRRKDGRFDGRGDAPRRSLGSSRAFFGPTGVARLLPLQPFIEPFTRVSQRLTNCRRALAFEISLNRALSLQDPRLHHSVALRQQSVSDVLALLPVSDVLAVINTRYFGARTPFG